MPQDFPSGEKERQTREDSGAHSPEEIPTESIVEEVAKILSSSTFSQSQRLSRFLRFTVEQFIRNGGASLKEYLLGTEVFDRDESYDPRTDSIVRVEAGRLRAKLKEYYGGEGLNDRIVIDLPKGSYTPIIKRRAALKTGVLALSFSALRDWRTSVAIVASLVAVGAAFWGFAAWDRARSLEKELQTARRQLPAPEFAPIWKPFLNPGARNFVIFGSPVFFANPSHRLFIRAYTIGDMSSLATDPLYQFLRERLGPLVGPRYDYALMRDAIALQRLTAFLVGCGGTLTAHGSHEALWDSIKDGNIIFLGCPRMNPFMQRLPVEQDFEWDADGNIRNRKPQSGEQQMYSTPSHEDALTYAVIASFPGLRPDREILLLMAHAGSGTQAAVDYVTRVETLRVINERIKLEQPGPRKHYQMLLRVFVDRAAPIKSEYITHHPVP